MSFPRYPKYKASGVEWLGDVPEHWTVMPVHRLIRTGRRITYGIVQPGERDESGRYMVRGQDYSFGWARPDTLFRVSDAVESPYKRARLMAGDIVMTIVGAGVGNVATVPPWLDGANITQTTARLSVDPERADPQFISAVFQSSVGRRSIELFAKGAAQPGLNLEHVRVFPVTVPPRDEQTQIASFLDRETSKIDGLVGEQRRLIELLKEKRQAVISHAVTKGLNPHAPLKPSGIEWLGDVPEHWRVGAIKYFVLPKNGAIKTGPFGSHLTSADMQFGTIKVYNQRSVIDCDFDAGDNFISEEKFAELASFETFPGDLLITTRGTIGRTAILPENAERGILHPCLLRLQPDNSKIDTLFLKTLIQDSDLMKTQLSYLSNATTIEVIYSNTIASVIIPVPPVGEQKAILQFLDAETAKLDALTAEAERGIELLQERRTALISAAVTGQIDVRGLVETEAA